MIGVNMRFTDTERDARYEQFGSDFEPSKTDPYAEFNVVHCDWCDTHTLCRSMFNGDVWVMSICKKCEASA
jgi:hypothetical protein